MNIENHFKTMPAYLLDTNVMLAASAAYQEYSALSRGAEPKDPALRILVYNELRRIEESPDHIVLDYQYLIEGEYRRNMEAYATDRATQEYGMLVLQNKKDNCKVNYVYLDVVDFGSDKIAALNPPLDEIVTDQADRKWVAASKAHLEYYSEPATIVYAAESDWVKIEADLNQHGIPLKGLLPKDWFTRS